MLAIWKLRQGFTPQRTDCTADIINAIDIDTILSMQIRDWYINLLDNADIRHLVTTDISSRLTPQPHPSGTVTIHLPDGIRRITHIKLKGWQRPAAVIRADRDPALASRQANPHTRRPCQPRSHILSPRHRPALHPPRRCRPHNRDSHSRHPPTRKHIHPRPLRPYPHPIPGQHPKHLKDTD